MQVIRLRARLEFDLVHGNILWEMFSDTAPENLADLDRRLHVLSILS